MLSKLIRGMIVMQTYLLFALNPKSHTIKRQPHNRLTDYGNKPAAGGKFGILGEKLSHFLVTRGGGGWLPKLVGTIIGVQPLRKRGY